MEESTDSVFNLITDLCENFTSSDKIKAVRSSCYEVLLRKRILKNPRKFNDLEGINDSMLNLIAWCYKLTQNYNFADQAKELEVCTRKLKKAYGADVNSFNSVLTFLLCLKDLPKPINKKLDLSTLPEIDDEISKFNNMFKLPDLLARDSHSTEIFKIDYKFATLGNNSQTEKEQDNLTLNEYELKDEGYSSPDKQSIWDIASQLKFSKRRNWESYGCGPPDKEKPFLSELGELSSLWVENLESLYRANNLFPSFTILNNQMKSRKTFIRDIKYLLVGIPSETFNLSSHEEFFISPGIMVEGITPDAIERYCSTFLFSGTCYRASNQMSTPNPYTRKYKYPGYVFTEFCVSMSRYLQFYRTSVMSISEEINFLTICEKTYQIQMQISTLASICKIGPYASEIEQMPHGVALLNYLYQTIVGLSDKTLCLVLYSILYPCCQVYFSRFLHQWLLKGTLNDPYGEFFITPNLKYLSTRGRTYWTRSYVIKEDIVPDFLVDLKDDILFSGRIMNLLQLSNPTNKLCVYLMGKNHLTLTCCFTHDKLTQLEQNSSKYYLEASAECGPKFSFQKILEKSKETNITYLQLIAKKRAITLKRLELERRRAAHEQQEKKLEELLMLKEQYDSALEQKQLHIYKEVEKEIKTLQEDLRIEQMREKLIEEEAAKIIDYYSELCQVAENRKEKIDQYIKTISGIHLTSDNSKSTETDIKARANSSSESFYSVQDDDDDIAEGMDEECVTVKQPLQTIRNSESMDLLNANIEKKETGAESNLSKDVQPTENNYQPKQSNIQQAVDNFELARKIKQKVMNQELGLVLGDWIGKPATIKETPNTANLTAAQRNKLKVLSSEFGIDVIRDNVKHDRVLTIAQVNRNKMMGHDQCFIPNYGEKALDNEFFVNKNLKNVANTSSGIERPDLKSSNAMKKSQSLQLDFNKPNNKPDSDKPIPMSVDSTPLSDLAQTVTPSSDFPRSVTPSSMFLSTDTKLDSFPTTAETNQTEDVFSFTINQNQKLSTSRGIPSFSKRVTVEEASSIPKNSLKLFLHESVSIPLLTQLKLANNELLKYFVEELNYLNHLESLRDYFFLQDGEFGRNITENLFEKLYHANFPLELINCRTLQHLVFSALDHSNKLQENSKHLSFKINNLPKCFDLGDPDVLDCLSLTYKVKWPMNILLPSDAVAKYDQVFKFLVKLNRVSWVLKKIFLELKILAKETGKKEIYLMSSPQYRRLHQCRHVMSHFMQTLQNYIVGDVLQPSWELFENSLNNVTNIDELYNAHTAYIKNILFRCMLNQKSVTLRNIIHKIFVVILKFYDYLRSRHWKCEDGSYIHPNFNKLDKIFKNFEEFVVYFFRVVRKVAKSRYQPHLIQFLDVLNVNDYYSKKLVKSTS